MSVLSKAASVREIWLMSAAKYIGNRDALMRSARDVPPYLREVHVRSARRYNHMALRDLQRARAGGAVEAVHAAAPSRLTISPLRRLISEPENRFDQC